MRLLVSVTLSLMLCGCVGIATITSTDGYYSAPRFALSHDAGSVFQYNDDSLPWDNTKKTVLAKWGEPQSKLVEPDGKEVWIYRRKGAFWRGAVVWVGLQIVPLLLPTGNELAMLTFEGETLVAAKSSENKMSFCGYAISDESKGFVCD